MAQTVAAHYDVGGVLLDRPFKVRRLGHFGYNCMKIEETVPFYNDLLGFVISDRFDFKDHAPDPKALEGLGDSGGYFLRYGSDHHSLVLFNKKVREAMDRTRRFPEGVFANQISWQVGSLEEVHRGDDWLREQGDEVQRNGRDWPGSNWHTYFYDPDGHTNELFYGMEQIGWQGKSKPEAMEPEIRKRAKPDLPQRSEFEEVQAALKAGIDINAGQGKFSALPPTYEVEGVLLPRPFRVTKIGPLSLFVKDVAASSAFYQQHLGLHFTEETTWNGMTCVFLRAGSEHHSLMLAPRELRAKLGFRSDSTTMALGLQVASFRQLRAARAFFAERGAKIVEVPREAHAGIDYAFHVLDPEGHCVQIYFGMEQLGWDGRPRPASARPKVDDRNWPEQLTDAALYEGEAFMGPLG